MRLKLFLQKFSKNLPGVDKLKGNIEPEVFNFVRKLYRFLSVKDYKKYILGIFSQQFILIFRKEILNKIIMKVATYNVNGINARLPVLLRWLEIEKPDVVCLQELKAPDEKIPKKEIADAGYNAIWNGQKRWNGVAILIEEIQRALEGEPDDEQSRYLEAQIEDLRIGCLYLPNGNPAPGPKFDYKLRWFDRLASRSKELLKMNIPVLLTGDYNVMPTNLDVYKPERWVDDALFRTEVRSAFAELLKQGWTDAIRKLYPEEKIYTFYDYFRNAYQRDAGLRIDHFLLSPQLEKNLIDAGVGRDVRGWEKSSDHCPVWIELNNNS